MNFVQFFTSSEVTDSAKLLEILYIVIGLVALYAGYRNLTDAKNEHRVGSAIFWSVLGLIFVIGKWIDPMWVGVLVCALVIPAIAGQVSPGGSDPAPTADEVEKNYEKIGLKIFIPALSMGLFALFFALFTKISSLVGIGIGVVVGAIILMLLSRGTKPATFLNDSRRMLDVVGPLSMLPMLLAALGAVFTAAGVGDVLSHLVSAIIPVGNMQAGIIVYAIGMALFTMVMGNAYAAITVMTVGIGAPFVLALGANPAVVGSLALTSGFCGTLMTPMAANFNIVPVAILEMKDKDGVIKKQVLIALFMLAFQICYMLIAA